MAFTQATAQKILNKILRNTDFTVPTTVYVSLHTADPGETGTSELTGGGYARKAVTFNAPSGKAVASSALIEWTNMPAGTVTHFGLWDSLTTGVFWWSNALNSSQTCTGGEKFQFEAGQLTATLT